MDRLFVQYLTFTRNQILLTGSKFSNLIPNYAKCQIMPKNFTKHFGKLVKVVKFREILSHLGFNGSIGWHILLDPYF